MLPRTEYIIRIGFTVQGFGRRAFKDLRFRASGLGFRSSVAENQVNKQLENDLETGWMFRLIGTGPVKTCVIIWCQIQFHKDW